MVKRLAVIVFIAAVVLGFYLFFSSSDNLPGNKPIDNGPIIAFGDSLVEGTGASKGSDFVSVLSSRLGKEIINAGKSGDTTASGLSRLEKDVLEKNPSLVIVLLGGNDALMRIPVEETFGNLEKIIDKIQQKGAVAVLLGVRGGIFGDPYDKAFEELAKNKNLIYVQNILEGIFGNPLLMFDQIHPNDKGYLKIADKVEPVLKSIINQN